MYVAKDVVFWLYTVLYGHQEVHTTSPGTMETQVPMPYRWPMRHHYVRSLRYQVPFLQTFLAPRKIEGPVTELRLPLGVIVMKRRRGGGGEGEVRRRGGEEMGR